MSEHGDQLEKIVQKLEELAGQDTKARAYLDALQEQLKAQARRAEERDELLAKYEEAYQKLTQPANRIGIFLRELEGEKILICQGDSEMVALCDPAVDRATLRAGTRVLLNEAYAVVGMMPPNESGNVVKVAEALADGRLRISTDGQGQQSRFIGRSESLRQTVIKRGDDVRMDPSGRLALEHFAQTETQDYFVEEVPVTPWSSIGGQQEAIQLIRETIEHPMLYPELYAKFDKRPVKGILLYGPPGCGKTLIGKAIAYNLAKEYSERVGHDVKEYFMHISGPKILNMWLGETERMVREIFDTARQRAKDGRLVVIFMDEAESVLRTRSSGRWLNISNTVVPQFCAELDGLVSLDNVVLVLTSNRPDYIDPAILRPERIDRKVKIRRPDRDSAREILGIYLHENLPLDPEWVAENEGEPACARKALVEATIAELWRETSATEFLELGLKNGSKQTLYYHDLVSGALLKSVVDRAKDTAIRRAIENDGEGGVNMADLTEALRAEYSENEIFPKSDVMDDWLKLIDVEPEKVSVVKPVGRIDRTRDQKSII
ncbi:MAG: AAA family ATPase [Chthonomonas sp.]|nr:AAA family ATPase [Chthonomonas sp.]